MTVKLFIPVGIPGCGKSTFAETFLSHAICVSTDAIRKEMFGSLLAAHDVSKQEQRQRNDLVFKLYHEKIRTNLQAGKDVIADATNLDTRARQQLSDIVDETTCEQPIEVHVLLFTNIQEAFRRNEERDSDQVVPPEVMARFAVKFDKVVQQIDEAAYDSVTVIG